ncbi:MAG: EF-Tu/IF-2/RF-3 family GTPase, partial [Balneolaceae bacterium]
LFSVIYDAVDEVHDALEGLLSPEISEEIKGMVTVREVFKVSKVGTIAGCYVTEGKVSRNNPIRIIRDGVVIWDGEIDSLKRFKDDVKEVQSGYECGISIVNFNDIKVGDEFESYAVVEAKRKLEDAR